MIFPSDFEQRLGFDQIRHRILSSCLGELARKKAMDLRFLSDPESIRTLLTLNHETKSLLEKGDDFPIGPYADPTPWFDIAAIAGTYLELEDLHAMGIAFQMIKAVNSFLSKDSESYPSLSALARPDAPEKKIIGTLRSKISDEGKMKDNASPELSRIRKRLREEEAKARRIADLIMRQSLDRGWSPEGSNPTIRDGRLVIPLLAEHKRKIKGYLVDQSSTGQTVFLQPADVLEANSDLRDLELEERKEIVCILLELTAFVHLHLEEIKEGYELLASIDFQRAKARLSCDLNAVMPRVTTGPALRWAKARHPLLFLAFQKKRQLVPLSINLATDNRFLLVSGPNAGGKSVCLKTVGLIQYMAQCGLLVPMDADAEVGVFDSIFLDIGDQQSLESDLSTYSSHLRNMAHFIQCGGPGSLVLMDELGSGTDPNFGGGIAQAILEQLLHRKCWGVATTHYYNLKVFASHFPGIRNASMQFDTEKLVPLFQLEIGQPGSSFAMEIARKIGLGEETLNEAGRIMGSELIGLETLMKQVAEEKVRIEQREKDVTLREQEVATTRQNYDELKGKLETQKKEILNRAKTEAATLLQETNREIEKTIRHIRENKAEKHETRKVRDGLRELGKKVKPQQLHSAKPDGPLMVGDKVRILGGEVSGTVLSTKGKTVVVQFGELRSSVKIERLVRSDRVEPSARGGTFNRSFAHTMGQGSFSPLLDIRGMRVDEVMPVLIRFMDNAHQFGLEQVSILHGKGEGVLRKVARDYLKTLKSVSGIRDEHADRGGDGITLVELA